MVRSQVVTRSTSQSIYKEPPGLAFLQIIPSLRKSSTAFTSTSQAFTWQFKHYATNNTAKSSISTSVCTHILDECRYLFKLTPLLPTPFYIQALNRLPCAPTLHHDAQDPSTYPLRRSRRRNPACHQAVPQKIRCTRKMSIQFTPKSISQESVSHRSAWTSSSDDAASGRIPGAVFLLRCA
jgi:hypothetical protein